MNASDSSDTRAEMAHHSASAVLVREAGVPFQPPLDNTSGIDPFAEWLSLMEVVQMLCPVWPARYRSMRGDYWRL
jgi:hypothetical protein